MDDRKLNAVADALYQLKVALFAANIQPEDVEIHMPWEAVVYLVGPSIFTFGAGVRIHGFDIRMLADDED